jgi:hypothetical protein
VLPRRCAELVGLLGPGTGGDPGISDDETSDGCVKA